MNGRERDIPPLAQPLTPREEEILACLGDEMSNRQIAEHLTVSLNTVKWYVRQVYNKLGVDNRGEAVTRARSLGLLPTQELGSRIRNNLPLAATPFVGRARELGSLRDLIADPHARLITISGPGGIGKTRLALEAARHELEPCAQFSDGVFFVSLAPLEAAAEIVSTLASALDFHFQESGNEAEQLLNYLRNKQMLLVMDNFEHILDGRSLLAKINEQAAGITLLVTSRERLQMHGEQRFPLGGLKTAQSSHSVEDSPAAELFVDIARRAVPDFEVLAGDVEPLLRICRMVEGMPLGLELAASWAGSLPLSEIAAEMEQSLNLLTTEHHDVAPRHRSMEAALDVSWRRLASDQQRVFKGLTVFRGGFTRTAAADAAGATLPLLVTLANKSWLTYDRQEDRYHIHELLRQYGASKLGTDPAQEYEAREKHSAFFCDYLQEREADWFGPRQKAAAAEIRDEIDNIQHAWRWATSDSNEDLLAQGLNSLCHFYNWEGRLKDGELACRLADKALSSSTVEQPGDDERRLVLLSQVLAWESDFVHDVARKEELLDQSQKLLDRAAQNGRDTRTEQAFLFLYRSYAASLIDLDQAIHLASLGLYIFRDLDNKIGEADALRVIGSSHLSQGDHALGDALLHDALDLSKQLGDARGMADTLASLGMAARHIGDYEAAEAFLRQSVALYRQTGNRFDEESRLVALSIVLIWAGKFVAARETVEEAIELARDLGQYPDPWLLNALTVAMFHLGNYRDARAVALESLELARQKGVLLETGWALENLGEISFVMGDSEQAKEYLQESVTIMEALGHVYKTLALAALGYVFRALGEMGPARDSLLSALQVGVEKQSISPILWCLPAAALLAADAGRSERALELYGLAWQFGYVRNTRWFADAARGELEGVRASLPEDVAAAAEARGREMDVWQTAEALLGELDGR